MDTLIRRDLLPRAAGSVLLMLLGAAAFALTAQDSWLALTGLLASLGGLALLYRVIRLGSERFAGRATGSGKVRSSGMGCVFIVVRIVLVLLMIAAGTSWIWFAGNDINEIRMLLFTPKYAQAQVIGTELVPQNAVMGYVHYAYRVTRTLAPEDRFAVPHSQYPRYRVGQPFEVTYTSAAPRVHRVGHVTWEFALRHVIYWLLLLANGAAYLFFPLWLLRFWQKQTARRRAV